ncbi:cation diffusion facilitator family transporter [Oikeobacillus pervagus]|uniref:Cation diffusion facilitator family transporter n=1 Tax=Oikeobacillus pervagus TaxID=1325931 RepID=A0AAJ1SZ63_9BACI|nr:cation diffusion facilitator family transporter [Oikeobacillus pervagus]MDQ0215515.1 cation diffusion facilitator family transporter [Oikeobacillus pervagus]
MAEHDLKLGERGAIISISAYIILSILKLVVGYMSGSEALKADGLNNSTDIIASVAVLIGLRVSQKPADEDHRYGHWRAETVSSLVASFIMMTVGVSVLFQSIISFFSNEAKTPDLLSAWTALFAAVIMFFVYRFNLKLGKQINSQAVKAAAKDNLSDALVSIGTAIGIIGAQFQLPWLDPFIAVIIGLIICKTAWEIFWEASHDLTDGFNEEELHHFEQIVLKVKGVKKLGSIKARKYGNRVVVDLVIFVNPDLNVRTSHHISDEVEKALKDEGAVSDAHVHIEPSE